ncbi:MAG: CapA family protein [Christensenellales bacterium]
MKKAVFAFAAVCMLLISGCRPDSIEAFGGQMPVNSIKPTDTVAFAVPTSAPEPAPTPMPAPIEINIMAAGDIMFQYHAILSAYDKQTKCYDFRYSFEHVKYILESADVAVGNFECTLGGAPYSQRAKLRFSAPDEAAEAVKYAGFDVVSTINNHSYDKGLNGLLSTLAALREAGLVCTGTRADAEEKRYHILDVEGIKIGFAAYTFAARPRGGISIHGYRLEKEAEELVNVFEESGPDDDLREMGRLARQMREDGAEIVVFSVHWGTEYRRKPNSTQKKIAGSLADAGVDIILGSHPHWLQTVDVLKNGETGGKTIVAYSLGNFISNQRKRFKTYFKYSEDCMILSIGVTKRPGEAAKITSVKYIPTWTYMYVKNGCRYYTVVPLEKAVTNPEYYGMGRGRDLRDAKQSLKNTRELMAAPVSKGVIEQMALE